MFGSAEFNQALSQFDAIRDDTATAIQNVVQLRRALVVMKFGPVDVHGVRLRGWRKGRVFLADEPVAPTAGAALSWCLALVADQDRTAIS